MRAASYWSLFLRPQQANGDLVGSQSPCICPHLLTASPQRDPQTGTARKPSGSAEKAKHTSRARVPLTHSYCQWILVLEMTSATSSFLFLPNSGLNSHKLKRKKKAPNIPNCSHLDFLSITAQNTQVQIHKRQNTQYAKDKWGIHLDYESGFVVEQKCHTCTYHAKPLTKKRLLALGNATNQSPCGGLNVSSKKMLSA